MQFGAFTPFYRNHNTHARYEIKINCASRYQRHRHLAWTHAVVDATPAGNTTLSAPISHINVHIRDGSILLLHQEPAYTIYETREGPYSLLVSLNTAGTASGNAYVDDGESYPPGANRILNFSAWDGSPD